MRAAGEEGLDPAVYRADELDALRRENIDETRAADIDLQATYQYLERHHIEIVRAASDTTETIDPSRVDWEDVDLRGLRFRQRPGRSNALGGVKFVFPNHFNVYLHDTPSPSLFNRVERDLSHGCVRLERPIDLARYVLRDDPSWTLEKIQAAMHAGTERAVALKQPLPVYLVYFTAWEDRGVLQTAADVYEYDKKQRALAHR